MPKMRKDLAEATKAVNTHDDISFVVSFGTAFHNPNGSIAAKIEDVHSPEGYKWAARIKAYTKAKEDKVYNNYALDGFWLTPE